MDPGLKVWHTDAWKTSDVASSLALAILVAFLCGAVTTCTQPKGTAAWKHSFCKLILASAVAIEFFFVGLVALHLPSSHKPILSKCAASIKGGKLTESLRDCTEGQGPICTKDRPCTPCDSPISWTTFDSLLWQNDCKVCTRTDPGLCRLYDALAPFAANRTEWCLESDGTVAPCARCCLDLSWTNSSGTVQYFSSIEEFTENDCSFARDTTWLLENENLIECADDDFPLATRFGCCPADAFEPDSTPLASEEFALGDGSYLPSCAKTGPKHAGWHYCAHKTSELVLQNSSSISVPAGCPLMSNGKLTGELYCRAPTLKASAR